MKKKIGIATVSTGHNFGSALQAYATSMILDSCGYESQLLRLKGSLIAGRDVRISKLLVMLKVIILDPAKLKRFVRIFFTGKSRIFYPGTRELFDEFNVKNLQPKEMSWRELKRAGSTGEYAAFLCGSDQIWNAEAYYVDPFYYLEFVTPDKRIAFAPSFGRSEVPGYNKENIKKKIENIRYLSVREDSGASIIKDLTGRDSEVLVDPTLVVAGEEWNKKFTLERKEERYMLVYFLDVPSERVKLFLEALSIEKGLKIVSTPYTFLSEISDEVVPSGPVEFLRLIYNAEFVCTDSFHGTVFSLNFKVPFFTFERSYGAAGGQSARLLSILAKTNALHRYEPEKINMHDVDYGYVSKILSMEREKSTNYLKEAINEIALS